ncbi:MAG: glycosyltransferase family 39 protein [Anaerolineae bacterium]|nr:glycosyltransferase family 39 protein [Anaerolineae bacterium]
MITGYSNADYSDKTGQHQDSFIQIGTRSHLVLPIILLTGFVLRLYKLGEQSLWYDETVSAFLASQAPLDLIAHTARDIHPPGYYLILHFWTILAGNTEFALAYLSLIFGVLLIALTFHAARYFADKLTAIWTALLVACSPYNIWYSQEVRMYTLGAVLGLAATYYGLRALENNKKNTESRFLEWLFWLGYVVLAAFGLYTLYYFAFLLVVINVFFLMYTLWPGAKRFALVRLLFANSLVLLAYLPWLPTAWRQMSNPPVPPWRSQMDLWSIMLESWSALTLGQSVKPTTIWFILFLALALFILGLGHLYRLPSPAKSPTRSPALFLFFYTFGPLTIIYLLSFITPLYHVRYVFTYSPAFYIILGAGLAWLTTRSRLWLTLLAVTLLLIAFAYSVYQYHFNPRYQADDYRSAVDFIQSQWQPGDALMTNAGYTYTAFVYYANFSNLDRQRLVPYRPPSDSRRPLLLQTGSVEGDPNLGWGDPNADFYPMSTADTIAGLEQLANDYPRLWLLRAYDTVTDPQGLIRTWLAENTIPLEDQVFAGESNIRAQGFLLSWRPELQGETVHFVDGMTLAGWRLPQQTWQPGQTIHLQLVWLATSPPSTDYKTSLKLWAETGELAGQGQDEWPGGTLYRATAWPVGQMVYHPTQLVLPADIPPGRYWLNVELYHPDTLQPLPRLDGNDPVVTLGPVVVRPAVVQ